MVTRGTYYDEEDHYSRRYSRGHGHGYPLSQDRELPSALHGPYGHARQHMSSHNRQSLEQDNNAQPRRRIPVACGRCRKRKIRCSGDPGNGNQCSNCKSAGNDSCQFLRVSSTEATLKNDAATDFGYDSAAPRGHCRMSPYGPQHHQPYTPSHVNSFPQEYPSYRQNSLSYQKSFGSLPSYAQEFTDETDFGMQSGYPMINQDPIGMAYPSAASVRPWPQSQAQPQYQKVNNLFVDDQPSYTHDPQLWTPAMKFPIRPHISSESKSLSLNGMSSALPAPINGTDRVLPFPASSRSVGQIQACPSYLRSTESILPMSQPSMHYSNNGFMSATMAKAIGTNTSANSENASLTYLPMSSSPESVPSSHMSSLGTSFPSVSSGSHDSFTPIDGNYQPGNSHRTSIEHQTSDENNSDQGNASTTLVNNQYVYQPLPSSQSYATPPIVESRELDPRDTDLRLGLPTMVSVRHSVST